MLVDDVLSVVVDKQLNWGEHKTAFVATTKGHPYWSQQFVCIVASLRT